jgi:putative restriction endonuclease
MNLLQRALIEKAGHDNGFEHVLLASTPAIVALGSARHRAEPNVQAANGGFVCTLARCQLSLPAELARSFPDSVHGETLGHSFLLPTEAALARWLRRAAALAQALPDHAVTLFEVHVQKALAALEPAAAMSTEVQRVVRQRVGQQAFRQAMLDYWGGACAVTGVALPQALRASHAKAWALCGTDAERLDVYNGFLLSANLDALFDSYLASFDTDGFLVVSNAVSDDMQVQLGISPGLALRWIDDRHHPYLAFHRSKCGWLSSAD